jgi:uncharacterized iron-regulated membrane protein
MATTVKLPGELARRLRRIMFFIHLWTGVILGLWFALVGGSGSIMAWLPELISFEMQARHPFERTHPGQAQIPLSEALSQFRKAMPDVQPAELAAVTLPNERFPYYLVPVRRKGGLFYEVDPYSGTVHSGFRKSDLIIGNLSNFHEMLLLGPKGLLANGIGAVFALFMLLTGLWLWWPSTWKQLRLRLTVKRGAPVRRLFMDLHNVFGAYLYVILFVASLTAVVLAFNSFSKDGLEKALDRRAGAREEAPPRVSGTGRQLSDDELVARAKAAVPDLPITNVRRALKPGAPFQAQFNSQRGLMSGATVWLDPYSGAVLKQERKWAATPGPRTVHLLEDLHYGFYGGLATKLLYTFAGLMPTALFVSGLLMWWKRKQAEKLAEQRQGLRVASLRGAPEARPQTEEALAQI